MISRRQFIRYSLGMAMLGWGGATMAKSSSLRFGTLPVVSIRRAYEIYSPLLDYFKQALKQPISLETPPNFRSMYQRILKNDFDLLISPPPYRPAGPTAWMSCAEKPSLCWTKARWL